MAAALLHRPFQRGFDRRGRLVDVVAIEAQPGLEPQAVAGAKPDRQHLAIGQQQFGERLGVRGRDGDLESVLAGIAGAGDETVEPCDLARPRIHEPHGGGVGTEFCQHLFGLRSLQCQQRAVGQGLDPAGVGQMLAQMGLVGVLAGGIDHQEQMIAEIRDHQVVENAATRVGELRVTLPSGRDRDHVLRHQPLQRLGGILGGVRDASGGRAQRDLAHMRDVEQAGRGAGMLVFP